MLEGCCGSITGDYSMDNGLPFSAFTTPLFDMNPYATPARTPSPGVPSPMASPTPLNPMPMTPGTPTGMASPLNGMGTPTSPAPMNYSLPSPLSSFGTMSPPPSILSNLLSPMPMLPTTPAAAMAASPMMGPGTSVLHALPPRIRSPMRSQTPGRSQCRSPCRSRSPVGHGAECSAGLHLESNTSLFYHAARKDTSHVHRITEADDFCPYVPVSMHVNQEKLYAKKSVAMKVKISKSWRETQGLSSRDVQAAFEKCDCCSPDNTEDDLMCTQCCSADEKVIAVKATTVVETEGDSEDYEFNIKSMCTSSSVHLQSAYVVLVCTLGGVRVKSAQLALLSREWKGRKNVIEGMNIDELPRRQHTRRTSPSPSRPSRKSRSMSPAPSRGFPTLTHKLAVLVKLVGVSVQISFNHAQTLLNGLDQYWSAGELNRRDKVLVSLTAPDALQAAATGVVREQDKSLMWYGVLVSVHTDAASVAQLRRILYQFSSNNGMQNPANTNLLTSGLVSCLASFDNC
eukprot:TRINITY_DN1936_c0_g1_i1.p1 TRINITY_DN1936_c0_g1~~TRINITY_DN1936_c0_g1_i1.p1  ORF type:complete len:514 (+),score=79.77 TRINITY_DN1936_c0_g1_i1:190-1731(+)